jgi:hypothetical protein
MEMLRRFLLVGLYVVAPFHQGSVMQLATANITALFYLVWSLQVMPYVHTFDNFLALGCSLSLSVLLLTCIFYRYAALTELPDIIARMSIEQRDDFSIRARGLPIEDRCACCLAPYACASLCDARSRFASLCSLHRMRLWRTRFLCVADHRAGGTRTAPAPAQ